MKTNFTHEQNKEQQHIGVHLVDTKMWNLNFHTKTMNREKVAITYIKKLTQYMLLKAIITTNTVLS